MKACLDQNLLLQALIVSLQQKLSGKSANWIKLSNIIAHKEDEAEKKTVKKKTVYYYEHYKKQEFNYKHTTFIHTKSIEAKNQATPMADNATFLSNLDNKNNCVSHAKLIICKYISIYKDNTKINYDINTEYNILFGNEYIIDLSIKILVLQILQNLIIIFVKILDFHILQTLMINTLFLLFKW